MSLQEPTIHVGVTRRIKLQDGTVTDYTVNLSGIPATSSDALLHAMLDRAHNALDLVHDELDRRAPVRRTNPSAFAPPAPLSEPTAPVTEPNPSAFAPPAPLSEPTAPVTEPIIETPARGEACESCGNYDFEENFKPVGGKLYCPDCRQAEIERISAAIMETSSGEVDHAGDKPASPSADTYIPSEDEVVTHVESLGIRIPLPPYEWLLEPIRHDDEASQQTAVNAGLSNIGFGGAKRHPAVQAILDGVGPMHGREVTRVTSIKDLTKADASVVLHWLANATTPQSIADLARATGQAVMA